MFLLSETQARQALGLQECLDINRKALMSLTDQTAYVPSRLGVPYPHNPNLPHPSTAANSNHVVAVVAAAAAEDWTLIKPAAYYPKRNHDDDGDAGDAGDAGDGAVTTAAVTTAAGAGAVTTTTTDNSRNKDKDSEEEDVMAMGMKVVSVRSQNPKAGLPLTPATILVVTPSTGVVEATIAGTYVTVVRTSAGPALAVQALVSHVQELVVFGAGAQAECHVHLMQVALQRRIPKITLINRTLERAEALRDKLLAIPANDFMNMDTSDVAADHHNHEKHEEYPHPHLHPHLHPQQTIQVVALSDAEGVATALATADVVAATTNTTTPLWQEKVDREGVVRKPSLKPGCLVTGIGSYTPNMQELPSSVIDRSHVVIDIPEAMNVGDLKHLGEYGTTSHPITLAGNVFRDPTAFLSQSSSKDYIVYKAVGTAIQDVLTAKSVIARAKKLGIGLEVDMD